MGEEEVLPCPIINDRSIRRAAHIDFGLKYEVKVKKCICYFLYRYVYYVPN